MRCARFFAAAVVVAACRLEGTSPTVPTVPKEATPDAGTSPDAAVTPPPSEEDAGLPPDAGALGKVCPNHSWPRPDGGVQVGAGAPHVEWASVVHTRSEVLGVAYDRDGDLVVAGWYDGAAPIEDLVLPNHGLYALDFDRDGFVARYSPSGALRWARGFGCPTCQMEIRSVAVARDGTIAAAARSNGPVEVDAQVLPADTLATVIALDRQGRTRWVKALTGDGNAVLSAAAPYADGFVVAGAFAGRDFMFDGAPLNPPGTQIDNAFLVLRLRSDGRLLWSRRLEGGSPYPLGRVLRVIEVPGAGLAIAGESMGPVSTDGQALWTSLEWSPFIAGLSDQGALRWGHVYPETERREFLWGTHGMDLAVPAPGQLLFATDIYRAVPFGGEMKGETYSDVLLGRLSAGGEELSARTLGGCLGRAGPHLISGPGLLWMSLGFTWELALEPGTLASYELAGAVIGLEPQSLRQTWGLALRETRGGQVRILGTAADPSGTGAALVGQLDGLPSHFPAVPVTNIRSGFVAVLRH